MSAVETVSYVLIGADGRSYVSPVKGAWGGHRGGRLYGRLDCPAALRAIARGGYVKNRVFFADEETAVAAGYRLLRSLRRGALSGVEERRSEGKHGALTSPFLRAPVDAWPESSLSDAEAAALLTLARARGAQTIAIGSGRDLVALDAARTVANAWK